MLLFSLQCLYSEMCTVFYVFVSVEVIPAVCVCVCVCALHCAKRGIHLVNALKVFSVCFSSSELLGARASETAKSDKREQEGS